jgi:hypothetical protein
MPEVLLFDEPELAGVVLGEATQSPCVEIVEPPSGGTLAVLARNADGATSRWFSAMGNLLRA